MVTSKNYLTYRDTVVSQEDLLYKTLETGYKNIIENQIKTKNLKEKICKDLRSNIKAFPSSSVLGKAYDNILNDMEANTRIESNYVIL